MKLLDAPLIQPELETVKQNMKRSEQGNFSSDLVEESTEIGSSSGIEDDDVASTSSCKIEIKKRPEKSYIQKDSVYFQNLISDTDVINDCGIDLEFEIYLNEENDLDKLVSENSENFEKFQSEVNAKIERLEKVDFESISDLKKMAIEKYGFVNKRFRRRAWPILVANRESLNNASKKNKKLKVKHLSEDTENKLSFENISKLEKL